jgi:hypothetical protein
MSLPNLNDIKNCDFDLNRNDDYLISLLNVNESDYDELKAQNTADDFEVFINIITSCKENISITEQCTNEIQVLMHQWLQQYCNYRSCFEKIFIKGYCAKRILNITVENKALDNAGCEWYYLPSTDGNKLYSWISYQLTPQTSENNYN